MRSTPQSFAQIEFIYIVCVCAFVEKARNKVPWNTLLGSWRLTVKAWCKFHVGKSLSSPNSTVPLQSADRPSAITTRVPPQATDRQDFCFATDLDTSLKTCFFTRFHPFICQTLFTYASAEGEVYSLLIKIQKLHFN